MPISIPGSSIAHLRVVRFGLLDGAQPVLVQGLVGPPCPGRARSEQPARRAGRVQQAAAEESRVEVGSLVQEHCEGGLLSLRRQRSLEERPRSEAPPPPGESHGRAPMQDMLGAGLPCAAHGAGLVGAVSPPAAPMQGAVRRAELASLVAQRLREGLRGEGRPSDASCPRPRAAGAPRQAAAVPPRRGPGEGGRGAAG